MALVIADRVKVTTTTTGTGALSLASAATGFQDFTAVGDGNTTYYAVSSVTGTEWEVGLGTYTNATSSLSRDTILDSSNSGSAVNFSAGTKDVYVVAPADKSVLKDASGNFNATTATALETARTIGGVSFDGSANINLPGVNTTGNQDTSGNAATATALETARTIGGVSFDGSANINLPGVNTAGNQNTSGNAATATILETARTIAGQSFNGSANISIAPTDLTGVTATAAEINILDGATLDVTELNYVDGVTSSIQTQLDAMVEKAGDTMTGALTLSGDPTSALHASTKQYVDTAVSAGIHYHDPVRGEVSDTEGNLNATYNNGSSGVGATLTNAGTNAAFAYGGISDWGTGERVLIYSQTDQTQNGVYTVTTVGDGSTAWVLTRATDADSYSPADPDSFGAGDAFFVQEGNGAGELYVMNATGTITFGTTNITFTQIASAAIYSAGTGLDLTGTVFSHTDTSSQASVNNSGNTFIQDVTLDGFGHVTALTSAAVSINNGTLTMATSGTGLSGSATFTANDATSPTFTVTSNATNLNTASTIVARDASGNFSAGTITAALSGNAATATALATARTIGGVSFDGTANINLPGVNAAGNQNTSGNAATATAWATGRTLTLSGDVSGTSSTIDGTGNITLTATVADDSHNHIISNVDGLQTALDAKQPLDADLTAIAALASTDGNFIVGSATGWVAESGATARTSLGLGSLATLSTVDASTITDNSVGAAELNVSGNGTTSQFLRSDGDGTFTWATPTDTDTTYSAGSGLDLTGTTFSVQPDLRDAITHVGTDASNYIGWTTGASGYQSFFVNAGERARMAVNGDFHADGDVIAYSTTISDERLKENIVGIDGALDKVAQLNGYTFTYKADGKISAGVIAQEVEKVLPEAVTEKELPLKADDGEQYKVVNYDALHGLLIEAVKELTAKVKELEAKVG